MGHGRAGGVHVGCSLHPLKVLDPTPNQEAAEPGKEIEGSVHKARPQSEVHLKALVPSPPSGCHLICWGSCETTDTPEAQQSPG